MILFWMNDLMMEPSDRLSEYTCDVYVRMGLCICRNRRPRKHLDEIKIWRME
jgi:hypothetical protein